MGTAIVVPSQRLPVQLRQNLSVRTETDPGNQYAKPGSAASTQLASHTLITAPGVSAVVVGPALATICIMTNSMHHKKIVVSLGAIMLSLVACAGQQKAAETSDAEYLPPNSADIHQEEMKEAEKDAEERRIDAAEEATEDVDEASVIKTDKGALTTDDVDTDPND